MAGIVTLDIEAVEAGFPVSSVLRLLLPPVVDMGLDTSPGNLPVLNEKDNDSWGQAGTYRPDGRGTMATKKFYSPDGAQWPPGVYSPGVET